MTASGIVPLASARGLALLDTAVALEEPMLVAAHFNLAALRTRTETGSLAPQLRSLVPTAARRATEGGSVHHSLLRRLERLPPAQREQAVGSPLPAANPPVLWYPAGELVRSRPA